MNVFFELLCS
jgi:tetratricopeptide (TPR) repeat protein